MLYTVHVQHDMYMCMYMYMYCILPAPTPSPTRSVGRDALKRIGRVQPGLLSRTLQYQHPMIHTQLSSALIRLKYSSQCAELCFIIVDNKVLWLMVLWHGILLRLRRR